jgi:hypothetical protein
MIQIQFTTPEPHIFEGFDVKLSRQPSPPWSYSIFIIVATSFFSDAPKASEMTPVLSFTIIGICRRL